MSNTPNAAERLQAQTRLMQGNSVKCSQCGSDHFYEVQVSKYRAGGSGSVEIQQESDAQTFPLLICLCGFPILAKPSTGRRHGGIYDTAHAAFRAAIGVSQDFLKASAPKAITDTVLEAAASKTIEGTVEGLNDRVNALEAIVAAPEHEKQDEKKGKKHAE